MKALSLHIGINKYDRKDEAFVLYDRLFLDDEFQKYLAMFKEGVKILVVADCCHSGTIQRGKKVPRFIPSQTWSDYYSKPENKSAYNRLKKMALLE